MIEATDGLDRRDRIDPVQLAKQHILCALIWTAVGMQAGRRPGRSKEGWRVGGRERGEDGEGRGVEGREGGSDDARRGERASVEEGVVEGGGLIKGRNEAWTARGKDGREAASGGGIEREREGASGEGVQGREENVNGGIPRRAQASVQYIHKPFHNAALSIDTWVLQMKNSEQVYIINSAF